MHPVNGAHWATMGSLVCAESVLVGTNRMEICPCVKSALLDLPGKTDFVRPVDQAMNQIWLEVIAMSARRGGSKRRRLFLLLMLHMGAALQLCRNKVFSKEVI